MEHNITISGKDSSANANTINNEEHNFNIMVRTLASSDRFVPRLLRLGLMHVFCLVYPDCLKSIKISRNVQFLYEELSHKNPYYTILEES